MELWAREGLALFTVDVAVSRVTIGPSPLASEEGGGGARFAVARNPDSDRLAKKGESMTHRAFVSQAPQANRALARRPLWLIVLLLSLWLSVLLLAMQAYPQSAGPEFPNPSNAHMVLAQPQDATSPMQFLYHESR